MQNNMIITPGQQQLTPEVIMKYVLRLQYAFANALSYVSDIVFDIDTPEDFNTMYLADFEKISDALKADPRALLDPAALPDVPAKVKKFYSLMQIVQPLLPPAEGQIIKPS